MWYNVDKTLSHNCLFNFVVGPRGVGKTYSCKDHVIRKFLKKKEQFVYLRRYDTEIKMDKVARFFDDIAPQYAGHDFTFDSRTKAFYCDGEIMGFYAALSKAIQYKSVSFPNVSFIIFDEFIIDQGLIRYLPNEVNTFLEMYSTISRLRDVTVVFLSNAITFTNPYFLYFNLGLQQGQKIAKKGDLLLEMVDNPEYTEKAASTRFGRIIAGTDYGNYAMQNDFLRDNDNFVEKMTEAGNSLFSLKIDDRLFTVYAVRTTNLWYVSEDIDPENHEILSLDITSHTVDSTLAKESYAALWFKQLQQKFYRAEVRFTTVKAKNILIQALKGA